MAQMNTFRLHKLIQGAQFMGIQNRFFAVHRKPRTYKWKKYPCIPTWMQQNERDPFDYKLRSPKEIEHEFKYFPTCDFPIQAQYKGYVAGDPRREDNLDTRDRIAKIHIWISQMGFAPL